MANGLLDGFWYTEVFSSVSTDVSTIGIQTSGQVSTSLSGSTLSRLNVGQKYHSGSISRGVAKGVDLSPRLVGSPTTNPSVTETAAMTSGKM